MDYTKVNPHIQIDGNDVEVCVSAQTHGPWIVPLWTSPRVLSHAFWWILNLETGQAKCIGRIGAKRTNYFDQAIDEANRRNGTRPPALS